MERATRLVLLALLLTGPVYPATGEETVTVASRIHSQQQAGMPASHQHSIERREHRERQASNMGQFRDANGVITLTNRVEKYRSRDGYTEIRIQFEPIAVPREYQAITSPAQYTDTSLAGLVRNYAQRYMLDESLIYAVIRCESNFNPNAVSRAGASGLMQLMPATAAEMGVTDIFDPAQNIAGGSQYLAKMLQLFGNDLNLALAGYNAGPEAVRRHGGIPPYSETQAYVRNVLRFQRMYKAGGLQARAELGSHVRRASPTRPAARVADKPYMVHFHSGLKQPADRVIDEDPYYFIVYEKRTYPVRKELVARIEEPA